MPRAEQTRDDTDDDQPQRQQPAAYTQADLAGVAEKFGTHAWAVPGIFREAGVEQMTEDEFRAAADAWHGRGEAASRTDSEQDEGS